MIQNCLEKVGNMNKLVSVESVYFSDESGVMVNLRFLSFAQCSLSVVSIPWKEVTPAFLESLLRENGCVVRRVKEVYKQIAQEVENYLYRNVLAYQAGAKAVILKTYSKLGWSEQEGELIFRGEEIYSRRGDIEGVYTANKDIAPHGSLFEVAKMLRECVVGNTPMEAVVAFGVAATLNPYIKRAWGIQAGNPVNHFVGDSTTGKSTALALFVSFGGSPSGENSNFLSYMATTNAILQEVSGICGYPIAIDEFSTASKKDLSSFIYALSNGQGRNRCKGNGRVKKTQGYEGVILSSGESDVLAKCSKNVGLRVRVFEFQVPMVTRNAAESRMIKSVATKNYGWVTPLVAKTLLEKGEDYWGVFHYWQGRVAEEVQRNKIKLASADRISDVLAMYMVSAVIANEILYLDMDLERLFRFLFLHMIIRVAEDADLGQLAYDVITRYYILHQNLYPKLIMSMYGGYVMGPDDEGFVVESSKGATDKEGRKYHHAIIFDIAKMDEILRNAGFTSTKVALESVKKKGLLKCHDKNRLTCQVRIGDMKTNMYGIWAHIDPMETPEDEWDGIDDFD